MSGAELESTARAVLRSQPNDYLAVLESRDTVLPLQAACRPLRSAIETGLVYCVNVGDQLDVQRDHDSRFNRNSVFLTIEDQPLGYLHAHATRAIGPEIDAGQQAVATIVAVELGQGEEGRTEVTVELVSA